MGNCRANDNQRQAGVQWGSKGNESHSEARFSVTGLPGCGAGSNHTQHIPGQANDAERPDLGSASQLLPHPLIHSSWVSPAAAIAPALPGPSWGVCRLLKVV